MPKKLTIQPQSPTQSDADYDAYLTEQAKGISPFADDEGIALIKQNLRRKALASVKPAAPVVKPQPAPAQTAQAPKPQPDAPIPAPTKPAYAPDLQSQLPKLGIGSTDLEQGLNELDTKQRVKAAETAKFVAQAQGQSPVIQQEYDLNRKRQQFVRQQQQNDQQYLQQAQKTVPWGTPEQQQLLAQGLKRKSQIEQQKKIDGIGDVTFRQLAGYNNIVNQIPQDSDFDRSYFEGPEFKREVYERANGNTSLFRDVANELAQEKILAHKNAPTKIAQMQQGVMDVLYKTNPAAYYGASGVLSGVKSLAQTGGFLEAAGKAFLNPNVSLGTSLTDFGKQYEENTQLLNKVIPEPKSKLEKGTIPELLGEAVRMTGEFAAPGLVTGGVTGVTRGTAKLANTAANKGLSTLANVLKSMPVAKSAQYLDNTLGMMKSVAPIMYSDYYEQALQNGYTPEEASRKALQRATVNAASFSIINPFLAKEAGALNAVMPKTFRGGMQQFVDAAKKYGTDAAIGGLEGGIGITADAYQDHLDAINRGDIPANTPFDLKSAIKSSIEAFPLNAIGIGITSAIGRHGTLPNESQASAMARVLNDRTSFDKEISSAIQSGRVPAQEAIKMQAFFDKIRAPYQEALKLTTKQGKPYTPEMAIQHSIETERLKEVADRLEAMRPQMEDIQVATEIGPDGNPTEVILARDETGAYTREAGEALQRTFNDLMARRDASAKALEQLNTGSYVKNRTVSGAEMAEIARLNSPENELRGAQGIEIKQNGPYKTEVVDIQEYVNDPEIQSNIETSNVAEGANAPILAENGEVIDGKKRIAKAISDGKTEMEVLRPITLDETARIVEDEYDQHMGAIAPNAEGLDKESKLILKEVSDVFQKALEDSNYSAHEAYKAAAKDIVERGYSREQGINMLTRVAENVLPEAMAEKYYNYALRESPIQSDDVKTLRESELNPTKGQVVQIGGKNYTIVDVDPFGYRIKVDGEAKPREIGKFDWQDMVDEKYNVAELEAALTQPLRTDLPDKPIEPSAKEPVEVKEDASLTANDEAPKTTKGVFDQAIQLFDQISTTEGSTKKRRLAEERRKLLEENPTVKAIDDNISTIYRQLEEKGLIKKRGNCP